MRAYRMVAWKTPPEYQEVPQPEPGPGQVLLHVGAAGICHSDLHVSTSSTPGVFNAELPFTLGHETAGWVEALGPARPASRSVRRSLSTARWLRYVRAARPATKHLRPPRRAPGAGCGLGVDGGMARLHARRQRASAGPLGDLDPVQAAPLTDAAVTPYRAIRRSRDQLGPGSVAVVIGIGGLGHVAVQILRAVAVHRDRRRQQAGGVAFASSRSAPTTPSRPVPTPPPRSPPDEGGGVDATFDLVGSEATLSLALETAAGSPLVVGVAGGSLPTRSLPRSSKSSSTSAWGSISDLRDVIALAAAACWSRRRARSSSTRSRPSAPSRTARGSGRDRPPDGGVVTDVDHIDLMDPLPWRTWSPLPPTGAAPG